MSFGVENGAARGHLHILRNRAYFQFWVDLEARLNGDLNMILDGGLEALLLRGQGVGSEFERADDIAAVLSGLRGSFAAGTLFGHGHCGIWNVRAGGVLHGADNRSGIDLRVGGEGD